MSSISDSAVVDALRRQMAIAVAKQVASAGNLANVDTPGYKAKEVNFAETLKNKLSPANATFPGAGAANAGVVLQDVEGYRHEEIGDMLGVSPGTSKSQLHRARQTLRGMLQSTR